MFSILNFKKKKAFYKKTNSKAEREKELSSEKTQIWSWLKSLFGFSCNMVWKNPNELFGLANTNYPFGIFPSNHISVKT